MPAVLQTLVLMVLKNLCQASWLMMAATVDLLYVFKCHSDRHGKRMIAHVDKQIILVAVCCHSYWWTDSMSEARDKQKLEDIYLAYKSWHNAAGKGGRHVTYWQNKLPLSKRALLFHIAKEVAPYLFLCHLSTNTNRQSVYCSHLKWNRFQVACWSVKARKKVGFRLQQGQSRNIGRKHHLIYQSRCCGAVD